MPFPIRAVRVDGGSEFKAGFERECRRSGSHYGIERRGEPAATDPGQNEKCCEAIRRVLARRLVEGYVRGMTMTDPDTDADFDTLAYARRLREAGVEEKQAEAHAEAARTVRAGLATKADLDAGLDSLETRFNARLDTRLAALETRLTIRFFGGMVAVCGVIVAAIKLL